MIGSYPPDYAPKLWRAVNLYRLCNAHELTLRPSEGASEDAWTMDAFAILRSTDREIESALIRERQERK